MDKELSSLAAKLAAQVKENGKKKVTVLDFTDLQGGSSELGRYIAEELTVNLVMNKKDFSVLDRVNLQRILAEHKLTATGLVDPDNAKKLGQFAGVDALILGTMTPKNNSIGLTAKIITTDTAEIIGAAKSEFQSDDTVKELISRTTEPNNSMSSATKPKPAIEKPFGDMQIRAESLKVLPIKSPGYTIVGLTLILTNTSATQTYGVGIEPGIYKTFNLSNSRGDEFSANEVVGIEKIFGREDGRFQGNLTRIPPRGSITITSKSQHFAQQTISDYRPYRLQTVFIWGTETSNDQYADLKKYNLILDIK